jgi:aminoglycoside 6'-N-acetyltransferase
VHGIDLFIGEPDYWNRGIGTRIVAGAAAHLFATRGVEIVTVDPRADNLRAIRCYEKAGFRTTRLLPRHELHEGVWHDCWLMERLASPTAPVSAATSGEW